jgi:hypothetical protein
MRWLGSSGTFALRGAAVLFGADSPFSPIVWLERVVNSTLCCVLGTHNAAEVVTASRAA